MSGLKLTSENNQTNVVSYVKKENRPTLLRAPWGTDRVQHVAFGC